MTAKLLRRIAIAMIALYAFGVGAVALAACGMDRGAMGQAMVMADGVEHDCHEADEGSAPMTAVCAAHCTSDVQYSGVPLVALPSFAAIAVLTVDVPVLTGSVPVEAQLPPPGPPHRILLHSFLI